MAPKTSRAHLGRHGALLLATLLVACGPIERSVDGLFLNPILKSNGGTLSQDAEDQAFFDSLFIVDLHTDSLLYSRGLEGASFFGKPTGHADAGRLRQGNIAVQVLSTVSQSAPGRDRPVPGYPYEVHCNSESDFNLVTMLSWLQHTPGETNRGLDWRQVAIERQAARFHDYRASFRDVRQILTADDFEATAEAWRRDSEAPMGAILAIEGLHFYEDRKTTLERLWDMGFRMASPTHHFNNRMGTSSTGCHRPLSDDPKQTREEREQEIANAPGLYPLGRKALQEMRDMGWTLDLAHASTKTIRDALAEWNPPGERKIVPAFVSHTGLEGQCARISVDPADLRECDKADRRNMTEKEVYAVAESGGAIGIIYWDKQHGYAQDEQAEAEEVVKAIALTIAALDEALLRHTENGDLCRTGRKCIALAAPRYIALGSDWDGSVRVPFDATGLPGLITALRDLRCGPEDRLCRTRDHGDDRRFSDDDIRAIAGWNACRVLMQTLPNGRSEAEAMRFCDGLRRNAPG